ncbi:MAG: serine protease [Nitrolancea sp.]
MRTFVLFTALIVCASCGAQGTIVPSITPISSNLGTIPTPTEFPMGSGQPAPLRDSLALIRQHGSDKVTGAALVITSDGFLVTVSTNLGKKTEIVLPDGIAVTPIRVASDPDSGLALLKVSAQRLVPVQLGLESINVPDQVFAAGFDETTAGYGQVAGRLVETAPTSDDDSPAIMTTNINFAQGFSGGALSDDSGRMIGLIVSGERDSGQNVIAAVPAKYVTDWISDWRHIGQEVVGESDEWPVLKTIDGLSFRYPTGWSVANENRGNGSYLADVAPNDPDVPAQISISIESTDYTGTPIDFAHDQFDEESSATIWGEVQYGHMPGARVMLSQEGGRVDVVYLFAHDLRIGIRLSAGYSVNDTSPQAEQITALFDAVLRSVDDGEAG